MVCLNEGSLSTGSELSTGMIKGADRIRMALLEIRGLTKTFGGISKTEKGGKGWNCLLVRNRR